MKQLFDEASIRCSRLTTRLYSTSFSLGIFCLDKSLRDPIYSIYGFVRFADEIVDSFHDFNKAELLNNFKIDTYKAISDRISLNPILNSFQKTVHAFRIETRLIEHFLFSMELDLDQKKYDHKSFKEYVLGSSEVVGLMCLRVFCKDNDEQYSHLKPYAMSLGSAFQKVNFLRDLKFDYSDLGRTYFPNLDINHLDDSGKKQIEESIHLDFQSGYEGIKQLPRTSRLGVYVAYVYYLALFEKIRNTPSALVLKTRIRIRNRQKVKLLAYSFIKHRLNLL